jgi:hypothetical protein
MRLPDASGDVLAELPRRHEPGRILRVPARTLWAGSGARRSLSGDPRPLSAGSAAAGSARAVGRRQKGSGGVATA